MSMYTSAQPSFSLVSEWACAKKFDAANPAGYWAIVHGPTEATRTVTFPVSLPAGAIVTRAWVQVAFDSYPISGAKYKRLNGVDIPSTGEIEVSIAPEDTSFDAVFSFAAYGIIYEAQGGYSGALGIGTPTLYVDYVDTAGGEIEGDSSATAVKTDKGDRLPRLLDSNLHELRRLHCKRLSVDLMVDPLSTAEMSLPLFEGQVAVDAFVEIFCPYGSAGIFRVYQTRTRLGENGGQECSLRHGIVTLADDVVTAGNALQAPVGQVFASIFAMQTNPRWVMGRCEIPDDLEIVLERNHQSLLAAFTDLTARLPDGYRWEFDQTVSPWEANLLEAGEAPICEFRLARNLQSVEITMDRDAQCTRLYAYGSGEGDERIGLESLIGKPYLDADNIGEAGVIARVITNDDIYDSLTLKDVAQKYLDRHKIPNISIRAGAVDLSRASGMSFDRFHLGMPCRLALPDYGMTALEKVVAIRWRDVINAPMAVEATLASRLRTASDEIAELMREATNGKLIGGVVNEETTEYNNSSVDQSNALAHYFDITGYGNTVSVRARYTPAAGCRLVVDGTNEVPASESDSGSVDILRYLDSDQNGVPTVGEHTLLYFARGTATIAVSSKITVKTIEKR